MLKTMFVSISKRLYTRRSNIYKLFKSYIIIIAILLAIMFALIYKTQNDFISSWMIENNNNSLEQAKDYVDKMIFSTPDNISKMILQDFFRTPNLKNYFYNFEYNYTITKYIQDYLSSLMASNNMIKNIALYYADSNYLISPLTNIKLSQYEFEKTFTDMISDTSYESTFYSIYVGEGNMFTSPVADPVINDNSQYLYFIRKIPNITFSTDAGGAIIVCVNGSIFYDKIKEYFPSDTEVILTDMSGTILFSSNKSFVLNDMSFLGKEENYFNSLTSQDNFFENINGIRYLISFNKSTFSNYVYVALTPMNNIITNVYLLIKLLIIITILTFAIGIVLSIFSAKSNTAPLLILNKLCSNILKKYVPESSTQNEYELINSTINVLSKKLSEQDFSIKEFSPILFDHIFISLIDKDANINEIKSKLLIAGINFSRKGYIIVVFKMKIFNALAGNKISGSPVFMNKEIEQIVNLYIAGEDVEYINAKFNNYFVYLFNIDPDDNNINTSFLNISEHLSKFTGIHLYMSISDMCNNEKDIKLIYKQACEYLDYSFIFPNRIMFTKDIKKPHSDENQKNLEHVVKQIIYAVQSNIWKSTPDLLVQLKDCICCGNLTYEGITILLKALVIRIDNYSKENRIIINEIIGSSENLVENSCNIDEFCELLNHVFNYISNIYERRQNSKNQEIIDKVKTYIKMNITNNCISLDSASELLGISSAHLSRLFKEATDENFVEFVMNEKLDYAKEQLMLTNLPVNSIAQLIGYSNTQYFISKFKARYGTTPNKYRTNKTMITNSIPK